MAWEEEGLFLISLHPFLQSSYGNKMNETNLVIPSNVKMAHDFVCDDAFSIKKFPWLGDLNNTEK